MESSEPIVDDTLPPELQAAVDAARQKAGRRWTDDLPEHGPIVRGSADPDFVAPEVEVVTDEDFERALEQWEKATGALFVLRLKSGR